MQITKEDQTLEALIDQFNEQSKNQNWDAAYGTAAALAEHYQELADHVRSFVVAQLKTGVVNRAKAAAKERIGKNKR